MSIKRLNRFGAAVRDIRLLRLIDYTERYNIERFNTERYFTETFIDVRNNTIRNNTNRYNTQKNNTERIKVPLCAIILILLIFVSGCSGRNSAPVLETYPPVETAENGNSTDSKTGLSEKQAEKQETDGSAGLSEEQPEKQKTGDDNTGINTGLKTDLETDLKTDLLTVHVCGAVQKQGVYRLPQGSRVCDAVDAAGGFAADADTSWLNLAAVIEDASQIRIPTREETLALRENPDLTGTDSPYLPVSGQKLPAMDSVSGKDDRIDLNTASREQLMALPGIGEAKAGQIINYREKNGRFETIEDIMKVPGIKNAGFEKLKDYITVR